MKPWSDAEYLVAPHVLGASWPLIETMLVESAREFFRRSLAWRDAPEPQNTVVGEREYEVVEIIGAEVEKVLVVKVDDSELVPLAASDFDRHRTTTTGSPSYYTFDGLMLLLEPIPSQVRTLTVEVAYRPSLTSRGLPNELFAAYIDRIAQGAIARIKTMPGRPYSDPAGAMLALARFDEAVSKAAFRAAKGGTRGRLGIRARFF